MSRTGGPQREQSSIKHLAHLKKLLPYIWRYRWIFAVCIFALFVQQASFSAMPLFMKVAIDSLTDDLPGANLALPAIGILVMVVLQFVIYAPARRALRRISISTTYDLRKRFFHSVQYQGPSFFNRYQTGDLMSRSGMDVNMVRMLVSFGWISIMRFILSIIVNITLMFSILSASLSFWVLLPLPLVAYIGFITARGMYPYYRERQEAIAKVSSFTQENLNGIRIIQAMAQEDQEIKRFRDIAKNYIQKFYRAVRYQELMGALMSFVTYISPMIILGYGGYLVLQDVMTLGDFQAFSAYSMMVTMSVQQIGWSLSMFTSAAAGTERVFEIIEHEPEVSEDTNPEALPSEIRGELEFRNLNYRYPDAPVNAISNINIKVAAGETIAFLGRVGCGKSTILKAAVRMVNTPEGTVFLDGQDIHHYGIRQLREHIALVPQHPFLFSQTIRENVTYDDPTRDRMVVMEAVHAAGLEPAISDLTDGLETIVGERGITLSGGQKQRATLARGLIRKSEVLLLDDCFSSVDTETEERIIEGLRRMRQDRTTVLISHRVSTARHADRIFVIDNGHILESGTHEELIELGGYYADLEVVQRNQDQDDSRKQRLIAQLRESESESASRHRRADVEESANV